MPDGTVIENSDVVQIMEHQGNDIKVSITHGNTVIFDSFSPEHEVRRRNINRNNISKLNHMPSRFPVNFSVHVRADSVAAVLCAETVSDYKVVDKRSCQAIPASDKRPDAVKAPHELDAKRRKITTEVSPEIKTLLTVAESETEKAVKQQHEPKRQKNSDHHPLHIDKLPHWSVVAAAGISPVVVVGGGPSSSVAANATRQQQHPPLPPPSIGREAVRAIMTEEEELMSAGRPFIFRHQAPCNAISAFSHPGLPKSMSIGGNSSSNIQQGSTGAHTALPPPRLDGGRGPGYRDNFRILVEAAEKSYTEVVGIMNFTSQQQQHHSRRSPQMSSMDLGGMAAGACGNKQCSSLSFTSNDDDTLMEKQLDPIFDINTLLNRSRPGTSDNIQAVVISTGDVRGSTSIDSGGGVVPDINLDPSLAAASVLQGIIITTMKEGCGSAAANRVVTPPPG